MKIRILDNTIRLRLSQTEVGEIPNTHKVSSSTSFVDKALEYEIIGTSDATYVKATFDGTKISIQVPKDKLVEWATSDEVGFENKDQSTLRILVEKDFQCLHKRPGEDETDNFPNPLADDEKK